MRITIHTSPAASTELQVGPSRHPYHGPLPEVCQTIVIPEDAMVDDAAKGKGKGKGKGKVKVKEIIWHYNVAANALSPEIVCRR